MKNYSRIAERIMRLGKFADVYQCGAPNEHHQVNLHFTVNEPYIIGYEFYVTYSFGEWILDYAEKPVKSRAEMKCVRGMKTQEEMLIAVEKYLTNIRESLS